jgi:cell division protein FtsQ
MKLTGRRKSGAARRRASHDAFGWVAQLPPIPWKRLVPAGALLLVLAGALLALHVALDQPVQSLSITGRFQRVQRPDVEMAVRDALHGDGMVSVDLARIARAVEQNPWIDRASVARSWPRTLRVQVVEQRPVARWGERGLVNTRGELFVEDAQHIPPELPQLAGPPGFEAEMTARCLAVQASLAEGGLRLVRMSLDERQRHHAAIGTRGRGRALRALPDGGRAHRDGACGRNRIRGHALRQWLCHRLAPGCKRGQAWLDAVIVRR